MTEHHSKEEETSEQSLAESAKQTWKQAHARLGTGGIIAVILGVIIILMLTHGGHHRGYPHGMRGDMPMMHMMRDDAPSFHVFTRGDGPESAPWQTTENGPTMPANIQFTKATRAMPGEMGRTITVFNDDVVNTDTTSTAAATEGNTSHYSGYQSFDNVTLSFTLDVKNDLISGKILGTDLATLTKFASDLKKIGLTVEQQEGTLTVSGPSTGLDEALKILQR